MNCSGRSACCCFAAPSSTMRLLALHTRPRSPTRVLGKPSGITASISYNNDSPAASISAHLHNDNININNNSEAYGIEIAPNISRAVQRARDARRDLALWERHSVVPKHTLNAFNELNSRITIAYKHKHKSNVDDVHYYSSIAIDSGCGTGLSTRLLADILPHTTRIIGLDRSAVRLSKGINYHHRHYRHQHTVLDDGNERNQRNAEIVRADMEHFWRLAVHNSWAKLTQYQFFFYPNPYPLHLKRRIYGRPSFPYVVSLGGRVEVRASWAAYLEDFLAAYSVLTPDNTDEFRASPVHSVLHTKRDIDIDIVVPISNFEKKFIEADQPIYRLVIDTRSNADRVNCPFKLSDDKLFSCNKK